MKILYVALDILMPFFLAVCISLVLGATPTVDSFAPPPDSPIVKEQAGEKRIAAMEDAAENTKNAPVAIFSSQDGKTGYDIRAEHFAASQRLIDTEKQRLNSEIAEDIQKIRQNTAKLDSETPEQWVKRLTETYHVYPRAGTHIIFADSNPCDISPVDKRSGCVTQTMDVFGRAMGRDINLYLEPAAVGDIYVLFHEIGHTKGIVDECTADRYSRSITGLPGGFYC